MQIRLAAYLEPDSIVDGEGIRTVIWTQGCVHNCSGCHNPETHNLKGGALVPLEDVYSIIDELKGQSGITFSGGDPFIQPKECAEIAKYAHKKGYNIWCYTGFTYEELISKSKFNKAIMEFLQEINVLVDGKFELAYKSYDLVFAGSSNQRIIDVPKSLEAKKVVLVTKYQQKETWNSFQKSEGIYV